jgi:ribosomal protein L11 methyltransferase
MRSSDETLHHISVIVPSEFEEAVAEVFENVFGQPAVTFRKEGSAVGTVSVYYAAARARAMVMRGAVQKAVNGLQPMRDAGHRVRVSLKKVRREDWAESWKKHFKPLKIGRSLLIKPSWSRVRLLPGQQCVVLDPGLSFGTGQHPTTEFCLRQLEKRAKGFKCAGRLTDKKIKRGLSFLDVGTGTGILAISAAKLGYDPVHAFDFDPVSVKVSRENACGNAMESQIKFWRGDLKKMASKSRQQYDVICANVEFDVLKSEHAKIIHRLKPQGILILAGILKKQFPAILETYTQAGLKLVADKVKKEWHSGAFDWA